jgi:predicted membrane protein
MKRAVLIIAVTAALGVTTSLAGAAGGARLAPVPYAPGSEYVYSGAGEKLGTLTGSGLGTQFNTVKDHVSR